MSASSSWREPAPPTELRELRCRGCRRLLCKTDGKGRVEVVCRDCKTLTAQRPKPAI
jgi:phage FluMu protein Com